MISEVDLRDWDPQIKVFDLVENEDGTVDCRLHANNHGFQMLIQLGFNTMLREALAKRESES